MSDDPQTFQLPDPANQPEEPQDSLLGLPAGDPTGPVVDDQNPTPAAQALEPDVLAEIRQTLAEEEEQSRRTSTTGRLIQRITGTLKRVTGPLGRTGPLSRRIDEEGSRPESGPTGGAPAEIPDDFLSGRLQGTTTPEQSASYSETEGQDYYQQYYEDAYNAVSAQEEELPAQAYAEEAPDLTGDEPISLLDSGTIAALGKAEEEARAAESEPDWMAEIRNETAELEEQTGEKPAEPGPGAPLPPSQKPRGFTAPLRSFITGILGGEGRRKQPEEEIPDDLLTGRLNRSMTTSPLSAQNPPQTPEPSAGADEPDEELTNTGALRALLGDAIEYSDDVSEPTINLADDRPVTGALKPSFFADLDEIELETGSLNPDKLVQGPTVDETADEAFPEERFDVFNQKLPEKPATGGLILDEDLNLTPEEEQLLWGQRKDAPPAEEAAAAPVVSSEAEPPMFTEEDIWGKPSAVEQTAPQPKVDREAWYEPIELESQGGLAEEKEGQFSELTDEDYAEAYLTGQAPKPHREKPPVNLMHQALENAAQDEFNPQNLRAIALEGMMDEAPSSSAYAGLYGQAGGWEDEEESTAPFSFKTWLAKRTPVEKFLLIEGLVAVIAVLVAVPFFVFIIAGGRLPSSAAVQAHWASPRPLPADLPYPIGLTLPGGWSFPLQKSTFIKGEWKPSNPEWLEGTELRRVIALPWNRQTEAVIQTFKTGDKVQVNMSNEKNMSFTVKSVERISTGDTSVFADLSPSLVIVLYKEDSAERWVVQCQPAR